MLKEKKHAAQMRTHAFSPHDSTGVSCQAVFWCVRLSACSTWPVCDKGMWSAEGKKKLLKLYLVSRRSPVSRQQTSYEIRHFEAASQSTPPSRLSLSPSPLRLSLAAVTLRGFRAPGPSPYLPLPLWRPAKMVSAVWGSGNWRRGSAGISAALKTHEERLKDL